MQKIINRIMYGQQMSLSYFMFRGITKYDSEDKIVQEYNRLLEIEKDIILKHLTEEQATELYELEVEKIHFRIKRRQFVCKVEKIAYLGGRVILAEFWGKYYAKIDLGKYLYKFPKIKEEDVFHKVSPEEYHVFFGEKYEVDVSSEFIWLCGENVTGKINPEEYEWIVGE